MVSLPGGDDCGMRRLHMTGGLKGSVFTCLSAEVGGGPESWPEVASACDNE